MLNYNIFEMKLIKHISIAFLVLAVVLSSLFLSAQKKSDRLKSDKKKVENEIAKTQKMLASIRKNKKSSLQEVQVLRNQINNREYLITELNKEIYTLELELDLNVKLSHDLDKKLDYMKSDYSRVVYLAYKNRNALDKLTFMLAADDFAQMYRRVKYFTLFSENVKQQTELIEATKKEVDIKNEEIILAKNDKLAVLEGKELEVRRLEVDRRAKTRATESLKKKEKELERELKKKQAKQRELDSAIKRAISEEIKAENARKAAAAKKAAAKGAKAPATTTTASGFVLTPEEKVLNTSFESNKGRLPWPVERGVKISNFGKYPHPDVPSVQIENRGIDILVDAGTPVRAVFQGVVTGVIEMMGIKVVMVRHGEYLTVYQNLSTVSVKKNDKVSTKQSIGIVAKSTVSGSHELHFEIWKGESYLNPSLWITK